MQLIGCDVQGLGEPHDQTGVQPETSDLVVRHEGLSHSHQLGEPRLAQRASIAQLTKPSADGFGTSRT